MEALTYFLASRNLELHQASVERVHYSGSHRSR
jgi:hypothetical protein